MTEEETVPKGGITGREDPALISAVTTTWVWEYVNLPRGWLNTATVSLTRGPAFQPRVFQIQTAGAIGAEETPRTVKQRVLLLL